MDLLIVHVSRWRSFAHELHHVFGIAPAGSGPARGDLVDALQVLRVELDFERAEEACFNTRVLAPKQYESLVRLLDIFAGHLAACSQALVLHSEAAGSPAIARARSYIEDHSADDLSLAAVGRVVNMSATYFSEKFKEATAMNFVGYVARTRVEKARNLLQNPNLRISEIAFEAGFQSLSQFNRAFKQIAGESPREHRRKLALV